MADRARLIADGASCRRLVFLRECGSAPVVLRLASSLAARRGAAVVKMILPGASRLPDVEARDPRPRDAWKHDHEDTRACDCGVVWKR